MPHNTSLTRSCACATKFLRRKLLSTAGSLPEKTRLACVRVRLCSNSLRQQTYCSRNDWRVCVRASVHMCHTAISMEPTHHSSWSRPSPSHPMDRNNSNVPRIPVRKRQTLSLRIEKFDSTRNLYTKGDALQACVSKQFDTIRSSRTKKLAYRNNSTQTEIRVLKETHLKLAHRDGSDISEYTIRKNPYSWVVQTQNAVLS